MRTKTILFVALPLLLSGTVWAQDKVPQASVVQVTCDIKQTIATDDVQCQISYDDQVLTDLLAPGVVANLPLEPGAHEISVSLAGTMAHLWSPASNTYTVHVQSDVASAIYSTFNKRAHLSVTFDIPDLVADISINGELVAEQATSYVAWIEPSISHIITINNYADPAAGDLYTWHDYHTFIELQPGQNYSITPALQQQWLKGYLELTCNISGVPLAAANTAHCEPTIDGAPVETIPQGESRQYKLDVNSHTVSIEAGPLDKWVSPPVTLKPYIVGGETIAATGSPVAIQAPPPPGTRSFANRPDEVADPSVQFLYILPADGLDRNFDTGRILSDATIIQEWLAFRTPGRSLRIDTYQGVPDVVFVQLDQNSSDLQLDNASLWRHIAASLDSTDYRDPNKLYAIYYEGASSEVYCGVGGVYDPSQYAIGILLNRTEGFVPCDEEGYTASIILHEIIHALGFAGMPACTNDVTGNSSHVDDYTFDLLYGGTETTYWTGINDQVLDYKRDDYYGHNIPGCYDAATSPFWND